MEKHFMVDIEATGIDHTKEELLAIGLLEVNWNGQFWHPGKAKEWILHTDRQPESEFAKEHMSALYAKCNAAPIMTTDRLRWEVLEFLRSCGTTGVTDTYLMGWNASNFDIPFLIAKGVLVSNYYETDPATGKDRMVGDFHYRIYEMGGAVSLAQNAVRESDRKKVLDDAKALAPEMPATPGKKHDALYDCYEQLRLLNGLIVVARKTWE